jgi:branched-chain amino acid transport system substrate-binding protein
MKSVTKLAKIVLLILTLVLAFSFMDVPAASAKSVKVGLIAPITGLGAAYGLPMVREFEIVINKWNKEGGLLVGGERYKVELIVDDSKYMGPVARQAADKEIFQDKVKAGFIFASTPSAAASPVFNDNKIVVLTHASSTSAVIGPNKPYVFNVLAMREMVNRAFWRELHKTLGIVTVAQLYPNDDAGKAGVKSNLETWPKDGLKSILEIPFERNDMDFSAAITKAMGLKPDAIDFSGSPGQNALFAKQSMELGYKGRRVAEVPVDAKTTCEVAGEKNSNGFISNALFEEGPLVTPALRAFEDEYIAKSKAGVVEVMIDQYQLEITAWGLAAQKARSFDSTKVMKAMETIPWPHVLGPGKLIGKEIWGINRQVIYPSPISELKNCKNYSLAIISRDEIEKDYTERAKEMKK